MRIDGQLSIDDLLNFLDKPSVSAPRTVLEDTYRRWATSISLDPKGRIEPVPQCQGTNTVTRQDNSVCCHGNF